MRKTTPHSKNHLSLGWSGFWPGRFAHRWFRFASSKPVHSRCRCGRWPRYPPAASVGRSCVRSCHGRGLSAAGPRAGTGGGRKSSCGICFVSFVCVCVVMPSIPRQTMIFLFLALRTSRRSQVSLPHGRTGCEPCRPPHACV